MTRELQVLERAVATVQAYIDGVGLWACAKSGLLSCQIVCVEL